MKFNEEFKAGDKIYILQCRFNASTRKDENLIEEHTITDVGRVYVTAGRYDKFRRHENQTFLTSYSPEYGYSHTRIAFATRTQAEEYIEGKQLINEIHDRMSVIRQLYDDGKINTEQLRAVYSILNG